jgi:hypothetical protein
MRLVWQDVKATCGACRVAQQASFSRFPKVVFGAGCAAASQPGSRAETHALPRHSRAVAPCKPICNDQLGDALTAGQSLGCASCGRSALVQTLRWKQGAGLTLQTSGEKRRDRLDVVSTSIGEHAGRARHCRTPTLARAGGARRRPESTLARAGAARVRPNPTLARAGGARAAARAAGGVPGALGRGADHRGLPERGRRPQDARNAPHAPGQLPALPAGAAAAVRAPARAGAV